MLNIFLFYRNCSIIKPFDFIHQRAANYTSFLKALTNKCTRDMELLLAKTEFTDKCG